MNKLKVILPTALTLAGASCITPVIAYYFVSNDVNYRFLGADSITTKYGNRECYVLANNKVLKDITFIVGDGQFWFVDNVLCWNIAEAPNKKIKITVIDENKQLFEVEVNINV